MGAITHRIEKVFVEVNTGSLESATFIKNNISRFLETSVFPKLEQTLDEFNQTGRVARIDSLNLNIAIPRDDYFSALEAEIPKQFSAKMKSKIDFADIQTDRETSGKGVEIISAENNREEVFLFFLKNGYLPWFGTENDVREFLQPENWKKNLENQGFVFRLKNLLKSDRRVAERFILQLNGKAILSFMMKSSLRFQKAESELSAALHRFPQKVREHFMHFLLIVSLEEKREVLVETASRLANAWQETIGEKENQTEVLLTALNDVFQVMNWNSEAEKREVEEIFFTSFKQDKREIAELAATEVLNHFHPKSEKKKDLFFENNEGEISVQNAGLVVLHPFLKSFFKAVKFLDEKDIIKPEALQEAVQTLHYLATGNEEFFEGNLVFEKFLCGIPLKMPVERKSRLTEPTKSETIQLLKEVIRQWPALKNTSPGGFQQMFLQRNGKLFKKEKNYKLIVERKAQDILLDKLDWNISLVKIPWLKELVFVEW